MGFQGDAGLIDCVGKMVFSSLEKNPKNDFLVTASMMQVRINAEDKSFLVVLLCALA